MRIKDILYRANQNIKNNKKRSFKIIFTVFLASFVIIIMTCLYNFSQDILSKLSKDTDKLTTVNIWGIERTKANGLVDVLTSDSASAWNYNDAKNLVDSFDTTLGKAYISTQLTPDFSILADTTHTFKNLPMGISFNELKNIDDFYIGEKIKDINGAIVTKKFIESAVTTKDFENNNYTALETKDIVGKILNCTVRKSTIIDGNAKWEEFNVPIRIDGVIDDKDNVYSNDIIGGEEDAQKVFNKSVLLIPIERIELLDKEFNLDYPFNNSSIVIKANSIDDMDSIVAKVDETRFLQDSDYSTYTNFKYLNFLLQLIFGILGISILISAVIGIANMMYLSFMNKIDDIKILKILGIKLFDLKAIYMCELIIMILWGVFLSLIPIIFIKALRGVLVKLILVNLIFAIFICFIGILPCIKSINKISENIY